MTPEYTLEEDPHRAGWYIVRGKHNQIVGRVDSDGILQLRTRYHGMKYTSDLPLETLLRHLIALRTV